MSIVNIVASGNFNQIIDLDTLSHTHGLEVVYDPKKYHGAYLIIEKRKITIYKSGKYIITGLKRIEDVERFYSLISQILHPILDVSRFSIPIIQNIVMNESLGSPINLLNIIQKHPDLKIEYEPEQFPGLICKRKEGTILLFGTGNMIITGLKKVEDGELLKSFIRELI